MKTGCYLVTLLMVLMSSVMANESQHHHSKYAGQEKRTIKSLSPDDIQQLKQGKGWGLAKAAELNGMPGPAHVLEMKDKIALSKQQTKQIQSLFDEMKTQAMPLGNKLIELEKKLNDSFANRSVSEQTLKQQLEDIAKVRSELRYVHLVTHLKTPAILTKHQVMKYNQLRGYSSGDPCKNIPEGHDAKMWKQHNGCK